MRLNCKIIALFVAVFSGVTYVLPGLLTDYETPYVNGFESGEIEAKQWIYDGYGGCEIKVSDSVVKGGSLSANFFSKKDARCEIVPLVHDGLLGKYIHEPFDEDRWYEFSVFLAEPWEVSSENEVVAQWHGAREKFLGEKGGRGPPLALRIIGAHWYITYGWDSDFLSKPGAKASKILWHGPLETERWVDWAFKVRWDYSGNGLVEVWKGSELIAEYEGAIGYNDLRGTYLKLGSYHPGAARILYFDDVRIAYTPSKALEK